MSLNPFDVVNGMKLKRKAFTYIDENNSEVHLTEQIVEVIALRIVTDDEGSVQWMVEHWDENKNFDVFNIELFEKIEG